jgi:hypothetical protein
MLYLAGVRCQYILNGARGTAWRDVEYVKFYLNEIQIWRLDVFVLHTEQDCSRELAGSEAVYSSNKTNRLTVSYARLHISQLILHEPYF